MANLKRKVLYQIEKKAEPHQTKTKQLSYPGLCTDVSLCIKWLINLVLHLAKPLFCMTVVYNSIILTTIYVRGKQINITDKIVKIWSTTLCYNLNYSKN